MTELPDSITRVFTEPMASETENGFLREQFQDLLAARNYTVRIQFNHEALFKALLEERNKRDSEHGQ